MINEDVRHIVEAELRDGEVLLWAETTSAQKKEKFILPRQEDAELFTVLMKYFFWFVAPLLIAAMMFLPSFRFSGMVVLIGVPVMLKSNAVRGRDEVSKIMNTDIGGYALTNLRFFKFDENLKIDARLEASNLQKVVEESECVRLSPIGNGVFRSQALLFLRNNYATTNFIRRQTSEKIVP